MATNTKNYNFRKPDESDYYAIGDQNKNWDTADTKLGDLEYPEFEDYTGGTPVPDAATALSNIKSKGKAMTLLSNIKAFCKGAVTLGMIVNNCVTNRADLPGSAAQLKVLMDLYTQLNSDVTQLNGEMLSRVPIYISGPPAGQNTSYVFSVSTAFKIQQIDIRLYSKGIFVATTNDGVLIAVSEDVETVIAFKRNGVWEKARIL